MRILETLPRHDELNGSLMRFMVMLIHTVVIACETYQDLECLSNSGTIVFQMTKARCYKIVCNRSIQTKRQTNGF